MSSGGRPAGQSEGEREVTSYLPFPDDQGPPEGWPTEYVAFDDFKVERERADENFGTIRAICKRLYDPDCENGCDEGLEYEGDEWCPCDCTFRDVPMQESAQDRVIERLRAALRPVGYAVGVHGSRIRDLDLIAVPWVQDAGTLADVIAAINDAGFIEYGVGQHARPHGRRGIVVHGVPASAGVRYIDLSIFAIDDAAAVSPVSVEGEDERARAFERWCGEGSFEWRGTRAGFDAAIALAASPSSPTGEDEKK